MKNFKFLVTVLTIILVFGACSKDVPCTNCACFNFVEPLRFSYLDSNDTDLLANGIISIDSVHGFPIVNGEFSLLEKNVSFEILNKVIENSETTNYFCQINDEFATINNSGVIGIDERHQLLIYRNSIEIDTLEFKWIEKIVEGETCCTCTTFPLDYLKYNGIAITEGSDSGAAIIRI